MKEAEFRKLCKRRGVRELVKAIGGGRILTPIRDGLQLSEVIECYESQVDSLKRTWTGEKDKRPNFVNLVFDDTLSIVELETDTPVRVAWQNLYKDNRCPKSIIAAHVYRDNDGKVGGVILKIYTVTSSQTAN